MKHSKRSLLEVVARAQQACKELQDQFGIAREEIDAILSPSGEPSLLQQLRALTYAAERRRIIAALLIAATDRWFSSTEQRRLAALAKALERATLSESEMKKRTAILGLNRPGGFYVPPPAWWTQTPHSDSGLSRAGVIGERCVALYDLLSKRIPIQRQQRRGARITRYNQRAMQYTAVLVSAAFAFLRHAQPYFPRRRRTHFTSPTLIISAVAQSKQ